jgi:hypothetical protein
MGRIAEENTREPRIWEFIIHASDKINRYWILDSESTIAGISGRGAADPRIAGNGAVRGILRPKLWHYSTCYLLVNEHLPYGALLRSI